jgi:hypothetical protein
MDYVGKKMDYACASNTHCIKLAPWKEKWAASSSTRKTEIFVEFIISIGFLKNRQKNSNFRRPELADGRIPNFHQFQSRPTKELVLSYSCPPPHIAHTPSFSPLHAKLHPPPFLLSLDLVGLVRRA